MCDSPGMTRRCFQTAGSRRLKASSPPSVRPSRRPPFSPLSLLPPFPFPPRGFHLRPHLFPFPQKSRSKGFNHGYSSRSQERRASGVTTDVAAPDALTVPPVIGGTQKCLQSFLFIAASPKAPSRVCLCVASK